MVRGPPGSGLDAAATVRPGPYPSGQRGLAVNQLRELRRFESSRAHQPPGRGRDHRTRTSAGPPDTRSEHPLHDHDVEPPTQLASHLALGAHALEATRRVKPDRRAVATDDARHDRVVPVVLREPDELGEEHLADP